MTAPIPTAEILSTGTELLQGLYADENARRLCQRLDALGFRVCYQHAARDLRDEIKAALADASTRSNLVVMTGGLGPTEDDVNRDVIADLWNIPLCHDPRAEHMLRERFQRRGIEMPERNVVQAMIPQGATVFYNHHGTAPGFALAPRALTPKSVARAGLVALPGPGREWMPMWDSDVVGWLASHYPDRPHRVVRTLHSVLLPESLINQSLKDLFTCDPALELTLLADGGRVRIRIIATAPTAAEANSIAERYQREVITRIPDDHVLRGTEPVWTVAQELQLLMKGSGKTIATAESCTGGLVSAAITDVPGASEFFLRGYVTYSNDAKMELLGVSEETLNTRGAVSRETALEMAFGARKRSGADCAVAITGIAGPDGATAEKPVGLVYIAHDSVERGAFAIERRFQGNRSYIRDLACVHALDMLRRWAANVPWPLEVL